MSVGDAQSVGGAPLVDEDLQRAVSRVVDSIVADPRTRRFSETHLPHRETIIDSAERLTWLLFPGFYGPPVSADAPLQEHVQAILGDLSRRLLEQVSGALRYAGELERSSDRRPAPGGECEKRARQIIGELLVRLPEIRSLLSLDVQAAYDGDPAARHTDETILCYPGLRALGIHRVAHELYRREVPVIPRMMSEYAHSITGIDIHPGAQIGKSFFIDHGTGVVIGETTVIGHHCKIYQGVTLGAKSFPKDERGRLKRGEKRHPTLEDHVTVYAGATILGGDTVIGAGCVINGGVFLTSSVPPGHVVRGPKFEITLRSNPELPPSGYRI